jgi:NADH:ubiquinone oxidoreductase subunit E
MSEVEFPKKSIFICTGSKCGSYKEIKKYFKSEIKEKGLKKEVELFKIECSNRCKHAPIVCVQPKNNWFEKVNLAKAKEIIKSI